MSRLDLVIFGATGFTGKHAVQEVARLGNKYGEITWAVAGRSKSKLSAIMSEASKKTGEDLSHIELIIADVADEASLKAMCSKARVVVNCCGPYREFGEPVVKAAIHSKTHYVDVSGEPQFMEMMQLTYDAAAREAAVYVVSACGFDSVPNDLGVVFLQQHFDGTLNSVESYLTTYVAPGFEKEAKGGIINFGTWDSLVHGISKFSQLPALRKKLYPEVMPRFKPVLKSRGALHKRSGVWCVPFPGADRSVVYRSQRTRHDTRAGRPVQFRPYVAVGPLSQALATLVGAVLLYLMSLTCCTRWLLLKFPWVFSLGHISADGPSEVAVQNTHFHFRLYGEGWERGADVHTTLPNKKIAAKVSGTNPGYGATVTSLIFSAIAILKEKDKMPANGGVITTATAFENTSLIKNLNDNNLRFEIIENK